MTRRTTGSPTAFTPSADLGPICASTPDQRLPRSCALTDALLGTISGIAPAAPDALAIAALRDRLERGLSTLPALVAGPRAGRAARRDVQQPRGSPTTMLRIGHYQVARALETLGGPRNLPRPPGAASEFRWTSRAARRSIGLAAVRLGLDGRTPTPADAVALVLSDPGGPNGVGRSGPGSCADWLASLAPPARSLVAADATTWATRLWTALDWGRLDPERLAVGGPDRWWRWRGTPTGGAGQPAVAATSGVAVRGRADVRLAPGPGDGPARGAQLMVLDGQPGPATRHALLLAALVDALAGTRSSGSAAAPARVVGWWPDCGRAWVVPVDARTLGVAADAVVATAGELLGNGAPEGRSSGQ